MNYMPAAKNLIECSGRNKRFVSQRLRLLQVSVDAARHKPGLWLACHYLVQV